MKRISKPGLRVYAKREDVPKVLSGLGIAIISTSEGLLTDKEARQKERWWRSYRLRFGKIKFSFQILLKKFLTKNNDYRYSYSCIIVAP